MQPERARRPGRNDLCPCGSGKKYKKCHLPEAKSISSEHVDAAYVQRRFEAMRIQRERQQGLGKPIISAKRLTSRADRVSTESWELQRVIETADVFDPADQIPDQRWLVTNFREARNNEPQTEALKDLIEDETRPKFGIL
jgi:SEC-C motif